MEVIERKELGEVEYFGEMCLAFREVYRNGIWKLIFLFSSGREVTYVID